MVLSELLKSKREKKGLLLREVASMIDVDTALISKIEKGDRKPTKEQLLKYANALEIDLQKLLILWHSEKIFQIVKDVDGALSILKSVEMKLIETYKNKK